jgi:predicted SAM-dependent methyltransferase
MNVDQSDFQYERDGPAVMPGEIQAAAVPRTSDGTIKLNLGGRDTHIDGFLTVDLRSGPTVDIQANINNLAMFHDRTVDEIYASNCLEHFPHTETVKVLREWRRVLKKRMKCFVSVPNLDASMALAKLEPAADWPIYLLYGDQAEPLNFHYINFTFPMLARRAMEAGFFDIHKIDAMPYGLLDASKFVDNRHGIPISLNVEMIA